MEQLSNRLASDTAGSSLARLPEGGSQGGASWRPEVAHLAVGTLGVFESAGGEKGIQPGLLRP